MRSTNSQPEDSSGRSGRLVRVLVADDHRIVREWIKVQLSGTRYRVVAEANTAAKALAAAVTHQPEVVLLDLSLPDRSGAAICAEIVERVEDVSVIVLSAYGDAQLVHSAIAAGARAYLLKDAENLDVPGTIDRVLSGESVIDPRAAAALVRTLGPRRADDAPRLSQQELAILELAAAGLTNREIGVRLYLSRHTVKEYLSNAMRKLDTGSRVEAVLEASRRGLISPRPRANAGGRKGGAAAS